MRPERGRESERQSPGSAAFDRIRRRWAYLLVPVAAFLPVCLLYLYTHPYPALAGGLFLRMAETISESGYLLPDRIPYYTADGIPFGYPPLMFYVSAVLMDLGVSRLSIARLFPVIPLTLALFSYYFFAESVLHRPRKAALAATVIGTSPAVLRYTLSAGGFVRATGLLFTVLGLFIGIRLFRRGSWTLTAAGAGLFGLTLLTHPKYTLFFGASYLVFYLWFDRTLSGLVRGVGVATGGLLIASPWWWSVGTNHGFDVFLRVSRTHGGIGRVMWVYGFFDPFTSPPAMWPFLVAVGGAYLVARRDLFLPAWFVATGVVTGNEEHLMLIGALIVARLMFDGIVPSVSSRWSSFETGSAAVTGAETAFLFLVVTYSVGAAGLYVGEGQYTENDYMSFIHEDDLEAMEWARSETSRDASYVVVGDTAEWFPLFAQRTSLVAGRGSEWDERTNYTYMSNLSLELGSCLSAGCMTTLIENNDIDPDYVYLPRDGYVNNRHLMEKRWTYLRPDLNESPNYEFAFANDGVVIYEYRNRSRAGSVSGVRDADGVPKGSCPAGVPPRRYVSPVR